jgi:hypothetical protein
MSRGRRLRMGCRANDPLAYHGRAVADRRGKLKFAHPMSTNADAKLLADGTFDNLGEISLASFPTKRERPS